MGQAWEIGSKKKGTMPVSLSLKEIARLSAGYSKRVLDFEPVGLVFIAWPEGPGGGTSALGPERGRSTGTEQCLMVLSRKLSW
jgi:hypothetical protein